jgi:hypothetical protein
MSKQKINFFLYNTIPEGNIKKDWGSELGENSVISILETTVEDGKNYKNSIY